MSSFRIQKLSQHLYNTTKHVFKPSPINIVIRSTSSAINPEPGKKVLQKRKQLNILDSHISYLDTEVGEQAVVFLHGNPTSSYLWRNIIPHVQPVARCVAPDLIGMGKSGKEPNNSYRFVDHYKYLVEWIERMDLPKRLHFVIHDWGSALGFHWCNLHRDRVASITYMEGLVKPMDNWDKFPEMSKDFFQALRSPKGEDMVLKKNLFVKLLLPNAVLRQLSDEEMAVYLEPYREEGESRRPTLTWPREIPIASDGPADVVEIARNYSEWLSTSKDLPKLYLNVKPGFFSEGILKVVQNWPNNKIETVEGHHFAQEDSPNEIGMAIKKFITAL